MPLVALNRVSSSRVVGLQGRHGLQERLLQRRLLLFHLLCSLWLCVCCSARCIGIVYTRLYQHCVYNDRLVSAALSVFVCLV